MMAPVFYLHIYFFFFLFLWLLLPQATPCHWHHSLHSTVAPSFFLVSFYICFCICSFCVFIVFVLLYFYFGPTFWAPRDNTHPERPTDMSQISQNSKTVWRKVTPFCLSVVFMWLQCQCGNVWHPLVRRNCHQKSSTSIECPIFLYLLDLFFPG